MSKKVESEVSSAPTKDRKTPNSNLVNKSLNTYVTKLEGFLKTNYPDCVLIPTREGGKLPLWAHKDIDSKTLWTKWMKEGRPICSNGFGIVLRKDLIVIDVDNMLLSQSFENTFPEMLQSSIQKTNKGKHYFFKRTQECDVHQIYDGARCLINADKPDEKLDVDIKTVCGTGTGGIISVYPSPNKEWVRCIYDYPPIDIPQNLLDYIVKYHISKQFAPTVGRQNTNRRNEVDIDEVKCLVRLLNPKRADDYGGWIQVGWCLHNIDICLLDDWIEFSAQSSKYNEGECEKVWHNMRNEGYGIGSLHLWAKEDNPSDYKSVINRRVTKDILECNGSHNAVAAISYKLLRDKYVCATPDGRMWYNFNGKLWVEDKSGINVRHELSTHVREHFIHAMHKMMTNMSMDELEAQRSTTSTANTNKEIANKLLNIAFKLQDAGYKDSVMKEMREYFYDKEFLHKLDARPSLLAFKNGVWDFVIGKFRATSPEDYVSLSVGYNYNDKKDIMIANRIVEYFEKLHPNPDQRIYVLRTIARQLYGDSGCELFHIHAGYQRSAGNGKTKFFELLEHVLGEYVRKFPVQVLTTKNRDEAGKPAPEYQYWRGRRILYCTEPKHDDVLHSGIMKDLTGGEQILYRLLFSNDVHTFRPQFKMHIMCNDPPKVDGSDEGVKRRIRKLDYISRFVEASQVNEVEHMYKRDSSFFEEVIASDVVKMGVLRYILEHYDKNYEFQMPPCVEENSRVYLQENNNVHRFITECIVKDTNGVFTLTEAKQLFKMLEYPCDKISTFKSDLEKVLGKSFIQQKKINGVNNRNVMEGYKLINYYATDNIDN